MTLEQLMKEYEETFGDIFPLYCCQGMSDEAIMDEILRHLAANAPFEYEPGVDY